MGDFNADQQLGERSTSAIKSNNPDVDEKGIPFIHHVKSHAYGANEDPLNPKSGADVDLGVLDYYEDSEEEKEQAQKQKQKQNVAKVNEVKTQKRRKPKKERKKKTSKESKYEKSSFDDSNAYLDKVGDDGHVKNVEDDDIDGDAENSGNETPSTWDESTVGKNRNGSQTAAGGPGSTAATVAALFAKGKSKKKKGKSKATKKKTSPVENVDKMYVRDDTLERLETSAEGTNAPTSAAEAAEARRKRLGTDASNGSRAGGKFSSKDFRDQGLMTPKEAEANASLEALLGVSDNSDKKKKSSKVKKNKSKRKVRTNDGSIKRSGKSNDGTIKRSQSTKSRTRDSKGKNGSNRPLKYVLDELSDAEEELLGIDEALDMDVDMEAEKHIDDKQTKERGVDKPFKPRMASPPQSHMSWKNLMGFGWFGDYSGRSRQSKKYTEQLAKKISLDYADPTELQKLGKAPIAPKTPVPTPKDGNGTFDPNTSLDDIENGLAPVNADLLRQEDVMDPDKSKELLQTKAEMRKQVMKLHNDPSLRDGVRNLAPEVPLRSAPSAHSGSNKSDNAGEQLFDEEGYERLEKDSNKKDQSGGDTPPTPYSDTSFLDRFSFRNLFGISAPRRQSGKSVRSMNYHAEDRLAAHPPALELSEPKAGLSITIPQGENEVSGDAAGINRIAGNDQKNTDYWVKAFATKKLDKFGRPIEPEASGGNSAHDPRTAILNKHKEEADRTKRKRRRGCLCCISLLVLAGLVIWLVLYVLMPDLFPDGRNNLPSDDNETRAPTFLNIPTPTGPPIFTPQPTKAPSKSPVPPTTTGPTQFPTTGKPTTRSPTKFPTTAGPTPFPTTTGPTPFPTTSSPTNFPTTRSPTKSPVSGPVLSAQKCSVIRNLPDVTAGNNGNSNFLDTTVNGVAICGDTFAGVDSSSPNRNVWNARSGRKDCDLFNYQNGLLKCQSVSARRCTSAELLGEVAKGTGCGVDNSFTYSSTPCITNGISGFEVVNVGDKIVNCETNINTVTYPVRCCGDNF